MSAPGSIPAPGRKALALAGAVIALSAIAAYHNSLRAPLVFDDVSAILENPSIRSLWPPWAAFSPPPEATTVGGRPLANLTLALNYAVSGTDVWSYHALNLAIHVLAGWVLFGVVRRTLVRPLLRARFGGDALPLALAVALLWTLHPLQTESVTYIVQRVESLAGLFYLLTLYGLIRSAESPRPFRWNACAVAACLLGVATKEVVATAPLVALLYDRTFLAGTFREAWSRRRGLYLGLGATWLPLALLVASTGWNRGGSAGFSSAAPRDYWLTQLEAIATYLKLSAWPRPLVFDYGIHLIRSPLQAAPYALVVAPLAAACIVALWRRPALGFLGAWFFLILAPSSAVPVATQTMAEHRMYLPLAAAVTALAVGTYALAGRRSWVLLGSLALAYAVLTESRNRVYQSNLSLWGDAAVKRPDNARAHDNWGLALFRAGQTLEAIRQYEESLRIEPNDQGTQNNLGNALDRAGRASEAIAHYEAALRIQPDFAPAHYNLGKAMARAGRIPEAVMHYREVLRVQPDYADAQNDLGVLLEGVPGRSDEAIAHLEAALSLRPDSAPAHFSLAEALARANRTTGAIAEYEAAIRLQPDFADARTNLGVIYCAGGRLPDGIAQFEAALRTDPDNAKAHFNLGNALAQAGRAAEAIGQFEEAVRIRPDLAEANNNLGMILCRTGRMSEGMAHIEAAIRSKPDYPQAHFARGLVLIGTGRRDEAEAEYEKLLQLHDPLAARLLQLIQGPP